MARFGRIFRKFRERLNLSLREFCSINELDAGNISKLERGIFNPPQDRDKLVAYAKALGLMEGTEEWLEFFDTASAESGRIPADIMSDFSSVEKLPVLFRTLRSERVDADHLDNLAKKIRES